MNRAVRSDFVRDMFSSISARYDLLNSVLSLGMHHLWKKQFINLTPKVESALDLCTGTGDLLPLLQKKSETVIGADFCSAMLDVARKRFGDRFELKLEDALSMTFADNSFDLVTVAFGVRNFENLEQGLSEINRVLKSNGSVFILEFGQAKGLIAPFYNFYSKYILPIVGGLISGNMDAYRYLPETAERFPCGANFSEILRKQNYEVKLVKPLFSGIAYIYQAKKV